MLEAGFSLALAFVYARKTCREMTKVKRYIVVTTLKKALKAKTHREMTVGHPNRKIFDRCKSFLSMSLKTTLSTFNRMLETNAKSVVKNARDLFTSFTEFCVYMNSRNLKKKVKINMRME